MVRKLTSSSFFQSLVVSDAEFPKNKLNGATSVATITGPNPPSQNGTVSTTVGRVSGWAVNFNKLLDDKDGLATFTVSQFPQQFLVTEAVYPHLV